MHGKALMEEEYTKVEVEFNGAYLYYIPININLRNADITGSLKDLSRAFSIRGILKWSAFLRKNKFSWIDIIYSIDLFIGIKTYKIPLLKIILLIVLGYIIIK